MRTLLLVICREYAEHVRRRSFLLTTLLLPVGLLISLLLPVLINEAEVSKPISIVVLDRSAERCASMFKPSSAVSYDLSPISPDSAVMRNVFADEGADALLVISDPANATLFSRSTLPVGVVSTVSADLLAAARIAAIHDFSQGDARIDSLFRAVSQMQPSLNAVLIAPDGDDSNADADASAIIAIAMSLLVYTLIISYGSMVMSSITSEKSNRIIEVLASCVSPLSLLVGKIVGVLCLILTQLAVWAVMFLCLAIVAGNFSYAHIHGLLPNLLPFVPFFIFYFIFGYLLYACLFAAIASPAESVSC